MQYNINVANGTGLDVRTNLNLAHQSLATNFFGATDPSLMSPVCAFPGSTWADTGNGLLKVRNADDSDWIVIGTIEADGTPKLGENAINTSELAMFNKRDAVTTSGTYTAPVTGWYKITAKGGGGGGGSAYTTGGYYFGGAGGGEGGTGIGYIRMTAGNTATVTIGAGGTGGASSGASGGDTSVVYNGTSITGRGGNGGSNGGMGGNGGIGMTIVGAAGGTSMCIGTNNITVRGGNGGGNGGGGKSINSGVSGGGGAGGEYLSSGTAHAGYNGGNGYVWFEYFDSSLNP